MPLDSGQAAEPQPESVPSVGDSGIFEEELYLAERRRKRSLRGLPVLIGNAVKLVWQTSRWSTIGVTSVQLAAALIATTQVLFGGMAASALLRTETGGSFWAVVPPLILLAVAALLGSIASGGMGQFGRVLGAQVQRSVTGRVLDITTEVDLVVYDDPKFHDQLSRVMTNVMSRPFDVVTSLVALLGGVVGGVIMAVTLFILNPLLLLILLISGPLLWFFSRKSSQLEFAFSLGQTTAFREREYLTQLLTKREDAAEVRANDTAPLLRGRYERSYDIFIDALRQQVRRKFVLSMLSGLGSGLVTVITILVVVLLAKNKQITVSEAVSAVVAIRLMAGRLQQVLGGLGKLFESALFLEDFQEFLHRSSTVSTMAIAKRGPFTPASRSKHHRPVPFSGIELNDVYFRYPNSNQDALAGVSMKFSPGEVIAVVGENGSGKTTLAKVLAGLYLPSSGEVHWNGQAETDSATLPQVRDQVALVLQDFTRYQFSATDNIALGRPELVVDSVLLETSASRVGADEFIQDLPQGYDTRLSRQFRGGRELSQGQWQRIALARAFYRNAPFVILDEPTAALDPRAEYRLYESMRHVLSDRTVVLISHRMQSVRGADRIIVMAKGRVVEVGNHEQLMSKDGLYAELVELQQKGQIGSEQGDVHR